MQLRYTRFEEIEFIFPANNTSFKVPFQDIPQLKTDTSTQEILITSIQVAVAPEVPNSFNQNPVIPETDLGKCFLTLYVDGEESIFRMPLYKLRNTFVALGTAQAGNSYWTKDLNNFNFLSVDWTKSYITLSAALTSNALQSVLFGIGYLKCPIGTIAALKIQRANTYAAGLVQQI